MSASCIARPRAFASVSSRACRASRPIARGSTLAVAAFKVQVEHEGTTHMLDVPEDKTILEVALDKGIYLPHDCKLGVCMTCPAKLVSGEVNQKGAMLSDDVEEKGYALLCMAYPLSDCKIQTVSEDELLDEQLCA